MMQNKPKKFANWQVKVPEQSSKKKKIIIAAAGIIGIIIVLVLLGVFFTGNKDKQKKINIDITAKAKEKPPLPTKPEMTDVQLEPNKPTSMDFIHALPILKYADMKYVNYSYQWFVNGDVVSDVDVKENVLDRKYFKKGDNIYCRVKAVRGKVEAGPIESDSVKIGNAPPILNFITVKPFDVPGEFRYNIKATDPDGDPLTYRLLAPLDQGITIDEKTGLIKWYISEAPVSESLDQSAYIPENEGASAAERPKEPEKDPSAIPSSISIVYEVSDNEDASVKGSINLNLTSKGGTEISR